MFFSGGSRKRWRDLAARDRKVGSERRARLRWVFLTFLCLLPSVRAEAQAWFGPPRPQGWLADRKHLQGPGFRVGNLELHPGVASEVGYDSNVFFQDQGVEDGFLLRLTGHLFLSTLGTERQQEGEAAPIPRGRPVIFRGGLRASYYHFFLDAVPDNVGGDAFADVTINPDGRVALRLHETFGRTIRPFTDRAVLDGNDVSFGRNSNVAGADVLFRSHRGVLSGRLGYMLTFDFFDAASFRYANNLVHRLAGSSAWRFFPRTALLYELDVDLQRYPNRDAPLAGSDLSDNVRIENRLGLNGIVTKLFSVATLVGYAAGFFENVEVDDFEAVTARIEGRYRPRPSIATNFGYVRHFRPSFIGNYARSDRGYVNAMILMGGRFLVGSEAAVSYDKTGIALAPDGSLLGTEARREGIRFSLRLYSEYRIRNWLGLTASAAYLADFTDFEFNTGAFPMAVIPDPGAGYQKVEAWLGVRAFY